MATVCQKCGVKGYEQLLVFCDKCQVSVEHRYCLDGGPKPEEEVVNWICEQCSTRVPKNDSSHANITARRKKYALRHRHRKNRPIKDHHLRKSFITKSSTDVDKPLNGTSCCLKKDVLNVAMIKESKPVDIKQEDLSSPTEKNGVHLGIEKSECLGDEGEDRKMKKKRKLIIDDESDEDAPPVPVDKFTDGIRSITQDKLHLPSHRDYSMGTAQPDKPLPDSAAECYSYNPVSPIAHPVWRGYFNVCDRKYGPAVAHLSNGACEKACDAADMLPQVLHFERLPRLEAWPESFKCSGPTKNNIAVYFFPGDVRAEAVFEQLLRDVIKKDLTLKVTVHKAELLVFPSMLLPPQYHLFEGEPYLWGVFRRRQDSRLPMPPDTHCPRLTEAAGKADDDQQYNISEDASTKCLNADVKRDSDNKAFNEPQTPGGQVSYVSWGLPGHLVPDQYCSRLNEVTEKPTGESEAACLTGRASRDRLSYESSHFIEILKKPDMGTFNSNMEFNLSGEYQGDSLAACLELFPLGAEDLGIAGKVQGSNEVDIELGLETVKGRKYVCKTASEEPAVLLFGKEIF